MSLIRINTRPSRRDLRLFSILWLIFLGLAGFLLWQNGAPRIAGAVWCAAVVVSGAGLIHPPVVRVVYLAAVFAAFPIGFVVSHVILAAVYYLVLTPVGLIMRMLRHDPLNRKFDAGQKTFWKTREESKSPESYFRQH